MTRDLAILLERVSRPSDVALGAAPEALLSIDITAEYPGKGPVLRGASFEIGRGEILGLVGQSGSGKSTLSLSILRLLGLKGGTARGRIRFLGADLMQLKESAMRGLRGRQIGFVPQSPMTSLNGALKIGTIMSETWRAHERGGGRHQTGYFLELLQQVSLPADESFLKRYPGQLSVGQGQRLLIALAIMHRPALLIADEPTSALDAITQSEILDLFQRLSRELNMGLLYISHDLLSIASICDRVAILHEGEVVEVSPSESIFRAPRHPFTQRLIDAMPKPPTGVMANYLPA